MKENTEERISKPHKTQRTLGKHPTTKQNKQKALVPTTTATMQIDPLREREREREKHTHTKNTRMNDYESQNSTTLAKQTTKTNSLTSPQNKKTQTKTKLLNKNVK